MSDQNVLSFILDSQSTALYLRALDVCPDPVSLAELVMAAESLPPAQVREDLSSLGFNPDEPIALDALRSALESQKSEEASKPKVEPKPVPPPPTIAAQPPLLPDLEYSEPHEFDVGRLLEGSITPLEHWATREMAEVLTLKGGYETLHALEQSNVEIHDYQIRAVRRVLAELRGNAILADEVGLGKTIEAGLVIKEYLIREMIHSCLILVPAPLIDQWIDEMHDKFGLTFHRLGDKEDISGEQFIVGSIDRAKRAFAVQLMQRAWDMLIVDECHVLKNHRTGRFRFIFSLNRKYCLLLSATPVQNELRELYNLITIARPGHLKGPRQFRKLFMEDRRRARNVETLRSLMAEVMIRNRRANTLIQLPPRTLHHHDVELTKPEEEFHDAVVQFCQRVYREYVKGEAFLEGLDSKAVVPKILLVLITLLKELTSSPQAVALTLKGVMNERMKGLNSRDFKELRALAAQAETLEMCAKVPMLLEVLEDEREPTIVYTEFLGTLHYLNDYLRQRGYRPVIFHGSLSGAQKRRALERFRDGDSDVFLSTETGGQGLNLQFCRRMINYDLPWNPMRVEQRIGRIHRFGQSRPVGIHTLFLRGTIEEYIMHVLTTKLDMFRTVIGELEAVLSFMRGQNNIEFRISEIVLNARNFNDIAKKMEELGEEIRKANEAYQEAAKTSGAMLNELV
jgi:SNF2 family DNA or RNA helicase